MAKAKYTTGSDGYFKTNVWDGSYVNGRKHYIPVRSKKSSADLEKKVRELKNTVEQRDFVRKTDIMFIDYAKTWKDVYKSSRENNTKIMYKNIIEKHFSALEYVKLADIERIHLQMLLNNASGKPRTQQQILMTFKQIINSAVIDQLFPSNVASSIFDSIDSVKYKAPEKRALTKEERQAVFKTDLEDQDKIFLYLLYGCGLRRGEALALTIFDFNFKINEVSINKSHEFIDGYPQVKSPKTVNGNRSVPLPDVILPEVKRYVDTLMHENQTYLFTMQNGSPVSKSSYVKKWDRIKKAIQDEVPDQIIKLTAHTFRHNYCSTLCYQIPTISIKQIAKLMGDTEKVVLDVYNHIILEKEDTVGAVNSAMNF